MILKRSLRKHTKGFTLIELLVSLTIMLVATGLLLSNYPESTIRLTLLNDTHTFALLIREAQIRGSAVDSSNNSIGGYGVYIDSATSSQALLFADSTTTPPITNSADLSIGDGLYDIALSPDKVKSTLLFTKGFTFKKLCVASSTALEIPNSYGFLCHNVNTVPIKTLTISFNRPSQIAHIYINGSSADDFPSACVQLYSLKSPEPGHVRSIQILHSGVITTSISSCGN